ncbi:MAG: hypothetical protein KW802_02100 [Candidatus Doudnabacteria bacterium]|nr:hypothetical protein [Candidatus Doudnabacteria bacterium]
MLETGQDFERELKLNLKENIQTELAAKREEMQKLQFLGNEFATDESMEQIRKLHSEIQKLESELKAVEEKLK